MSPRWKSIPGKFRLNVLAHAPEMSEAKMTSKPALANPRVIPPAPANKSTASGPPVPKSGRGVGSSLYKCADLRESLAIALSGPTEWYAKSRRVVNGQYQI